MVALCLPVIPVYFTGSLRRFMVISLLLEQVQQHENEYVVTLINPSTRSFRTALIILHPTKAWQYRFSDYTPGLGCCSMALWHTVTAPDTVGGWRTCRGSPLVLEKVIHGLKLLSQVYFVFLNNRCYARIWPVLLGHPAPNAKSSKNKSLKKPLKQTRHTSDQFCVNSH